MWSLNFDQIWINKWKNEPKTITGKTLYIFYALLSINFAENLEIQFWYSEEQHVSCTWYVTA